MTPWGIGAERLQHHRGTAPSVLRSSPEGWSCEEREPDRCRGSLRKHRDVVTGADRHGSLRHACGIGDVELEHMDVQSFAPQLGGRRMPAPGVPSS